MKIKKKDKKRKKISFGNILAIILFTLLGFACGYLGAWAMDAQIIQGQSFGMFMLDWCLFILALYASGFLQIIIHEAGHLVFGLLSGYSYCSFRIGSLVWIKVNGKIKFKRMSLAGTGGQCLMCPPDMADGKVPYVLYNLGGSIMNVLAGLLFLLLFFVFRDVYLLSSFLIGSAVIGFFFALTNGIPIRMGSVDNDGYNALSMGKDPEALYSFWLQMKINAMQTDGVRLRDMPDEWFTMPEESRLKNSMIATIPVFIENRLMDMQDLSAASELTDWLLSADTGMIGLYRSMLVCDRICCELISGGSGERTEELLSKAQLKFMKQMKNYITVCRTEYVIALLKERDEKKASAMKAKFEKCAASHPSAADVASERELVELAERAARELVQADA